MWTDLSRVLRGTICVRPSMLCPNDRVIVRLMNVINGVPVLIVSMLAIVRIPLVTNSVVR